MATRNLTFPGHSGDQLAAYLEQPASPPRAYALYAHCFTCSKQSAAAVRVSKALTEHGIAVLRFDFTGLGQSGGNFADTNFSSNLADLLCAADFLRIHHQAPRLLIGHSLGGTAVLAVASQIPEADAVATIGAPADPEHVVRQFGDALPQIQRDGGADISLAGRPFHIKRQLLEDLQAQNLDEAIPRLGKALLVMHSPLDTQVGIDNASHIFGLAKHPKSFVSLDTADHLLSRQADAEYVALMLAAWTSRYLPMTEQAELPLAPGVAEVIESGTGKFTQSVRVGKHHLSADEPKSVGGDDWGPAPYDYLLAGLGACTNMTLRIYAERKAIPLTGISLRLSHQRIHAQDCANCEKGGQIGEISRTLVLKGPLNDSQRQDLLRIADRCPVHRTLEGEIKIRTHLADA